jgi:hypothetical protein
MELEACKVDAGRMLVCMKESGFDSFQIGCPHGVLEVGRGIALPLLAE